MSTLFSIQCDTCLSKLKVTSQSAIGQILACPKCGSMVQVQPPPGYQADESMDHTGPPAAVGDAASATATSLSSSGSDSSAFEDIDQLLEHSESSRHKAASNQTAKDSNARGKHSFPPVPPPRSIQDAGSAAHDGPLLPSDQWTSQAAKARQKLLLLYGGSAVGLVVAIFVIVVLVMQFTGKDKGNDLAQADNSTVQTGEDSGEAVDADEQAEQREQDDQLQLPDDEGKSDVAKVEPADEKEKSKIDPQLPADEEIDKQIKDVALAKAEVKHSDEELPDFIKGRDKPKGDANIGVGESAIADLTKLSEILDSSEFDEAIAGEMPSPDLAGDFAKEIDFIKKPLPLKNENLERGMSLEIEGIQFKDHLLAEAILIIETISSVPVTLDPAALELAKMRTTDKVDLTLVKTNPHGILQAIFEPHGLAVSQGKHGFVVSSKSADALEKRAYDISEVAADSRKTDRFAELLQKLISPESWNRDEGAGMGSIDAIDGKLEIVQTAGNHRQIADLLKKIRIAKGLDSGADPAEKIRPLHQIALAALKTPTEVEFILPDKLADLVAKLAKQQGISVVIDWESLNEKGWNLQTEVPFGAPEETLRDSFENLLVAMKLSMLGYGDGLFAITSPEKAAMTTAIEVYPVDTIVSDDVTANKLAGQVQRIVGAELAANPAAGFFINTDDGYYLIAKLSQNKQIVLDNYLASVRSSLAKASE